MFKPANTDLRRPAYLQNGTKENILGQLSLLPLVFLYVWIKETVAIRREQKRFAHTLKNK